MAYPHLNSGSGGMSDQSDIMTDVIVDPYPGQFTKAHMGPMMGVHTRVTSYYLPDRIIIQVSQNNKLSQQIHVELIATPTAMDTTLPDHEDEPLPLRHLTPRTLLGGGGPERETIGHLFASQIASFIATKDPNEMRPVVVGLGFEKWNVNREAFFDLMALVQYVLK